MRVQLTVILSTDDYTDQELDELSNDVTVDLGPRSRACLSDLVRVPPPGFRRMPYATEYINRRHVTWARLRFERAGPNAGWLVEVALGAADMRSNEPLQLRTDDGDAAKAFVADLTGDPLPWPPTKKGDE